MENYSDPDDDIDVEVPSLSFSLSSSIPPPPPPTTQLQRQQRVRNPNGELVERTVRMIKQQSSRGAHSFSEFDQDEPQPGAYRVGDNNIESTTTPRRRTSWFARFSGADAARVPNRTQHRRRRSSGVMSIFWNNDISSHLNIDDAANAGTTNQDRSNNTQEVQRTISAPPTLGNNEDGENENDEDDGEDDDDDGDDDDAQLDIICTMQADHTNTTRRSSSILEKDKLDVSDKKNSSESQNNDRRKKIILIILVIAAVASIAIGLGLGLAGRGGGRDDAANIRQQDEQDSSFAPQLPITMVPSGAPSPIPCSFESPIPLPNVFTSCACLGIPGTVPNMAQPLHQELMTIIQDVYMEANFSPPLLFNESCDYTNLAFYWSIENIQETNNVDINSLRNRYLLASIFSFWSDGGRKKWTNTSGWLSSASECTWAGIECSHETTVVTAFEVIDNGIRTNNAGIPLELFLLNGLKTLNLGSNAIRSMIPNEISLLSNLETLVLDKSRIVGTIPESLYSLTNLKTLSLGSNILDGSVSPSVGNLANLELLDVSFNLLKNGIPSEIGLLTNLSRLSYRNNPASRGTLPSEIGLLSRLAVLDLNFNAFRGQIPTEVGRMTVLKALRLGTNNWSGTLPSEIGEMRNLTLFDVNDFGSFDNNGVGRLGGTLPTEIGLMTKLTAFGATGQSITGTIPSEIGKLSYLRQFFVANTLLTGTLPTEMGMMSALETLDLFIVDVNGTIPTELDQLPNRRCFVFRRTMLVERAPLIPPSSWCFGPATFGPNPNGPSPLNFTN